MIYLKCILSNTFSEDCHCECSAKMFGSSPCQMFREEKEKARQRNRDNLRAWDVFIPWPYPDPSKAIKSCQGLSEALICYHIKCQKVRGARVRHTCSKQNHSKSLTRVLISRKSWKEITNISSNDKRECDTPVQNKISSSPHPVAASLALTTTCVFCDTFLSASENKNRPHNVK